MCIEFKVVLGGGTKDLVTLAERMAQQGVNLATIATEKLDDRICLRFYPSDCDSARDGLRSTGAEFVEKEVILVEVEDRLGQYALVTRELAQAGVEIVASHLLTKNGDTMQLVFEVDKLDAAREVLGDQIVEPSA